MLRELRQGVVGRLVLSPLGLPGTLILAVAVVLVTAGPELAPYDPLEFHPKARLGGPTAEFWFGTDQFGRDILTRIIYGARTALFVGFVELILEFVKPVTLSMRLFGNIYGGEVALAIVVALAGAFLIPVALYGLEIILTTIQALIFATLTLMFILAAIESHHEEGHEEEEALAAEALADHDSEQGAAATA